MKISMYLHFTGYLLNNRINHNGSFPYALSTESVFTYEFLASYYWASPRIPDIYNNHRINIHLMKHFSYFTEEVLPIPFDTIFRITHQVSEEYANVYYAYDHLLS